MDNEDVLKGVSGLEVLALGLSALYNSFAVFDKIENIKSVFLTKCRLFCLLF